MIWPFNISGDVTDKEIKPISQSYRHGKITLHVNEKRNSRQRKSREEQERNIIKIRTILTLSRNLHKLYCTNTKLHIWHATLQYNKLKFVSISMLKWEGQINCYPYFDPRRWGSHIL